MADIGPVIAEQLKKQGIDASYAMPPDFFDRFEQGDYTPRSSATAAASATTPTTRWRSTSRGPRRCPAATG